MSPFLVASCATSPRLLGNGLDSFAKNWWGRLQSVDTRLLFGCLANATIRRCARFRSCGGALPMPAGRRADPHPGELPCRFSSAIQTLLGLSGFGAAEQAGGGGAER